MRASSVQCGPHLCIIQAPTLALPSCLLCGNGYTGVELGNIVVVASASAQRKADSLVLDFLVYCLALHGSITTGN